MLRLELNKLVSSTKTLVFVALILIVNISSGLYTIYHAPQGGISLFDRSHAFDLYVQDTAEDTGRLLDAREYALLNLWFDEEGNFRQPDSDVIKKLTPATGSVSMELGYISDLKDYLDVIYGYDDYLKGIQTSADEMRQSSFAKNSSYTVRNIDDIAKRYEPLNSNRVDIYDSQGALFILKNYISVFSVVLSMVFFSLELFVRDRYDGVLPLIKSTVRSRSALFLTKSSVLSLVSSALYVLIYASNVFIAKKTMGLGNTEHRIQSIEGFFSSPWDISILDAMVLNLTAGIIGCICLSFLMAWITSRAGSIAGSIILILSVSGIEFALYHFIPFHSVYSFFSRINIFTLLDCSELLSNYYNINLAGYPVNGIVCGIITAVLLTGTGLYFGILSWNKQSSISKNHRGVINKDFVLMNLSKVAVYEWRKLLFGAHGSLCIILIIVAELLLNSYFGTYKSESDRWYEYYSESLKGPCNSIAQSEMDRIDKEFEDIYSKIAEYNEQVSKGEISHDYARFLIESIGPSTNREIGYSKAKSQFEYVKSQVSKGRGSEYVPVVPYEKLFDKDEEILCSIPLFIAISVCIPLYSSIEQRYDMWTLLGSSFLGKRRLKHKKKILLASFIVFMTIAAYLPRVLMIISVFIPEMLSAPANSISYFSEWSVIIRIWEMFIFLALFRLFGMILYGIVISKVAEKMARPSLLIIICINMTLIPCVLYYLGYDNNAFLLYFITGIYSV